MNRLLVVRQMANINRLVLAIALVLSPLELLAQNECAPFSPNYLIYNPLAIRDTNGVTHQTLCMDLNTNSVIIPTLQVGSIKQLSSCSGSSCIGGGMTNPMTAVGDIIVGGAAGTPTRVGQGANGTFWGVQGGVAGYYTPAGGSFPPVGIANSTGAAWGTSYGVNGNSTTVQLYSGTAPTTGHYPSFDANHNLIDGAQPSAGSPAISSLTNATGSGFTSNGANSLQWQWNLTAGNNGLILIEAAGAGLGNLLDLGGNSTGVTTLNVHQSAPTSMAHFGASNQGGWITSPNNDAVFLSGGVQLLNNVWTARATSYGAMVLNTAALGGVTFYGATGTTAGNSVGALTTLASINAPGLTGTGSRCLHTDGSGNITAMASDCTTSTGNTALNAITPATAANGAGINNLSYQQNWTWSLTGTTGQVGMNFAESAASTNTGGGSALVLISTIAGSTIWPFRSANGSNGFGVTPTGNVQTFGTAKFVAGNITGVAANCVQADTNGNLTGTGLPCGSGSGGHPTCNFYFDGTGTSGVLQNGYTTAGGDSLVLHCPNGTGATQMVTSISCKAFAAGGTYVQFTTDIGGANLLSGSGMQVSNSWTTVNSGFVSATLASLDSFNTTLSVDGVQKHITCVMTF